MINRQRIKIKSQMQPKVGSINFLTKIKYFLEGGKSNEIWRKFETLKKS